MMMKKAKKKKKKKKKKDEISDPHLKERVEYLSQVF
jgi:hypothetical protein